MFKSIKCFFSGKRILEIDEFFISQVYEIGVGWCGIDKGYDTWGEKPNSINEHCRHPTLESASDHLENYLEHKRQLKVSKKKKIHYAQSVPKIWRILRRK